MAKTSYAVGDAEVVKLWSEKLFRESLKDTYIGKFMGKSSDSMIQIIPDTQKSAGDRVTVTLRAQLAKDGGITGDNTVEGNEEALQTYTDNLYIDQQRKAVRSGGKMSDQRIPWSIREEAYVGLKDFWRDLLDTAFFNQVCGNTAAADKLAGNNAAVAPDANHFVYPSGDTSESDVNSGAAKFSMEQLDYAVERAKTLSANPIRPIMIDGQEKYVAFLHPYSVTDLRTSTTTGDWKDIQKAALQGGQISKNAIYTGALGEWNNVILHQSTRVPTSTTQPNVRRNVLCGAQAAVAAFGQGYNGSEKSQRWVEKMFDYDNQFGVSSAWIWGLKKTRFNSADFATLVMPSYAVAHG
jgi:N4-gp56 family major capsid protein